MQYTETINKIHILNPAAGKGRAITKDSEENTVKGINEANLDTKYVTKNIGDAENYVFESCQKAPTAHFVVHGGDGTINEVVNGIVKGGASDIASFSVLPFGTGNDFVKNFEQKGENHKIDLIKYNERYCVNMVNIGFDCSVVFETAKLKKLPFVSGSMAYILGVCKVFFRKMGRKMEITYTDENSVSHTITDDILLCAVSNGSYCGGGFKSSPHSNVYDGIMEILIVKKIPRLKFIKMISKYRKGTHIDKDTMEPIEGLKKYMSYKKCTRVEIKNIEHLCVDGEIEVSNHFHAEVAPSFVTYVS